LLERGRDRPAGARGPRARRHRGVHPGRARPGDARPLYIDLCRALKAAAPRPAPARLLAGGGEIRLRAPGEDVDPRRTSRSCGRGPGLAARHLGGDPRRRAAREDRPRAHQHGRVDRGHPHRARGRAADHLDDDVRPRRDHRSAWAPGLAVALHSKETGGFTEFVPLSLRAPGGAHVHPRTQPGVSPGPDRRRRHPPLRHRAADAGPDLPQHPSVLGQGRPARRPVAALLRRQRSGRDADQREHLDQRGRRPRAAHDPRDAAAPHPRRRASPSRSATPATKPSAASTPPKPTPSNPWTPSPTPTASAATKPW
jgi:hypothetical protein